MGKSVSFQVINGDVYKDLANLTNELANARKANDALKALIAAKPTIVTQWMKFIVTNTVQVAVRPTNTVYQAPPQQVAQTQQTYNTPAPVTNSQHRVTPLPTPATNTSAAIRRPDARTSSASPQLTQRAAAYQTTLAPTPARPRTYVVKAGETMAEVARRTGVTLQKLQAANPSIEPRRLKAGQTLNIPSQ
jgi:LysM repeat protein